jgi:hypothetical protein
VFFNLIALDILVIVHYSIYMSTEKKANLVIKFLLAVTTWVLSARLVDDEENHSCRCRVCVEGNCGEQIKVTESFDVYVEVSMGFLDCKT